ncbi:hypothetical protein P7K49_010835 [Saguinus oedipus]|uniref:Uncharacterized protein n=1 Tax=Saguinus oedipus TaxID=9490 RepID=A0ABQ9VNX6_SAGOE|nr:hypothetical protein P7K49_010835 [Saguinus oedipus]
MEMDEDPDTLPTQGQGNIIINKYEQVVKKKSRAPNSMQLKAQEYAEKGSWPEKESPAWSPPLMTHRMVKGRSLGEVTRVSS